MPTGQLTLQLLLYLAPLLVHELAKRADMSDSKRLGLGILAVAMYGIYNFAFGILNTQMYKSSNDGHEVSATVAARQLGISEQIGAAIGSTISLIISLTALK